MLKDSILNTSISDKEDTRVGSVTPKYTMQRTVSTPKPPVSSPSFKSAMLQARSAQQERQTQTGTGAIRANLPSHNVDWKATTSAMAQKKNQYGAALDAMFPTQKHSAADIMMLDQLGIAERKGTINLRNTIPSANLNRVIQQYKNEHNGKAPQYNWEVQDWAEKRGIIANPKADNAEWSNLETAEHDLRLDEYESAEIEKRMTADALDRAAKAEGITPAANFALADIMPDEIRRESMYAGLNDTLEGLQTDNADALAFDRKYPELSHLDASNTSLYHADNISAHGNNGYAYKYVTQEAQDYLAAPTRLDTKTTAYLEQYNDLMADGVISVKQYNEFRVQLASMIDEAERRGITVEALVNTDPATKTYVEGIDENIAEFKRQKDANDKLMRDGSAETYEGIRSAIEQGEALSDEETAYYTQIVGTDISEAIKEDSGYKATVSALQDYGISKIEEYQAANPATIDGGYDYGVTNGYTYTAVSAQAMQYVDDIMKLAVSNGVDFDTMCASFGQNPTEVMQGAFDKALDDYVSLGQKVFEAYSAAFDGYKNMGLDTSFEQNVQSAVNAGDITSDQGKLLNDYYGTSTNNTMDRMALKQGDALEKGMFDAGFARSASQQAETETEAYKTGEVLKSEASGEGNLWYAVTRGAYGGAVMHLRSWGESIYFLMREDDATREADYRVMYSPSEVRQHHVEAISNIEDPTLRNMLMKQLDAFDGDIYNFKFDFRDAGVRDFIAKKDTTLRLLNAEGLDVLTPGQMDFMEAEMSAVNSGLYSLEELVLTRGVAGALGVNLATASKATRAAFAYPASMITMGLSEQAEVGNYILDQGGSKAEASAKGLLTNFVNSGLEVFGEGVEADIFGTAGILDDIDFTNSNWSQSLGLRVLKSTGKEGLATATQLGASISANILAKTAKEIPGEIIEELGQTAFSELMKTGNIDNVDAGEIVKNTILSTLIQGGVTNTVSGASTALSYRNGGEISSAIKTALVEEEGRYQENKMALETASANEMEGVVYTQEEIDEAVRKFSDNVSLTAKKNKFVAERVALGIEEQIVNTGLMAQEQTAKQTLDRATAAIPEAQAKADEAIRQFDEASAEFKYSEAADDADALRRFETAQQTAQLAQEGVTDAITAQVEAQRAYDAIKQKENDIVRMLHEQATLEAEAAYNPEAVQAAKEQIKQQELETLAQRHEARMREILNSTGALPEWFATKANALFSVIDDKVFRDYAQTRANVLSEVGDMVRNTFRGWGVVFERLNGHEGAVSFEGKNVYIDPEATPGTIINGLVAHEITHLAERSGNYNALVNAVKDAVYSGEDGEARFNADIAKIIADRKENGIEIGEATALHELVADLMARNILTGSSADTLAPVDTLATNWLLYVKNGNKAFGDTVMNWLDRRAKDMRKMGAEFGTNADYFARIVDQFRDTLADATANLENGTKPIASNTSTDSTETNVASNATAEPKSYNPLYESEAEALMRRARSNRANGEVSFYEDSKLNQQLRDDRVARGEPETIDDPADIVKALIDGRTDFTTTQELAPAWIDDEGYITTTENASAATYSILPEIESIENEQERADVLNAYNYIASGNVANIDTVVSDFMSKNEETQSEDTEIAEEATGKDADTSPASLSKSMTAEDREEFRATAIHDAIIEIIGTTATGEALGTTKAMDITHRIADGNANLERFINEHPDQYGALTVKQKKQLADIASGKFVSLPAPKPKVVREIDVKGKKLDLWNRGTSSINNPDVKPYYNTHWNLFHYARDLAQILLDDMYDGVTDIEEKKGKKYFLFGDGIGDEQYGAESYYKVYGITRHVPSPIAALLDGESYARSKWSYEEVIERLKAFIDYYDSSTAMPYSKAWIKTLECELNYALTNGYTTSDGERIKENPFYVAEYQGKEYDPIAAEKTRKEAEPETFDDDEITAKTQEDVGVAEFSANTYSDASRNDKQRSADILFSADTFRDSSFARAVEDLLGFALKQAAETGDIQTYNRTIGKIYGITAKNKYRAGNTVTSPVNILRLLATETSGNLYEGGGVGKTTVVNPETKDKTIIRHLADYDAKSRAIVSDRIDASNFAAVMLDVAKNIEAKIPDFHSGVLKADGTELGLQDFFFDYMTTRDSVIAANPALSSLKQEIDAFKAEMQKNKETSTMLDAIEHRRDQLCKLTDTALVAQTYKVRVESMLRSKADARSEKEKKNGVLRKIYADMVDRTVYASWLDNISNKINGTSGKNYTKTMQIGETSEAYLRRRAQTWIDGACADMGGNATGHQSATDIMHKHKVKRNQYSVLNDYLMAKEALDRYELYEGELAEIASKGEKREPTHKPPFGIDEDNEVFGFTNLSLAPTKQDLIDFIADVEANNKNVADACADLYEWWDGFMRTIAVNEGLLTEEEYDRMHREHPHYAPLKRKDDSYSFMRAVGGSTEQVINPFEQMLAMQTQFVNNAARNRTYRAFDTVYNNTPGLGIIASKIDASDIATGARTLPTSGNTITVHRADGTTAYYIVKDKNLLDMMNDSGNEIQLRGFFKVAGAVTRNMAKLTTGVNMLFAVKNMTRDFQHAVTYGSFASNYFTGLLKWLSANVDVWRYALTGKSTQQMEDFANMGGYGYERYDVGQKKSFGKLKRGIFVNNTNVGKVVSKTLSGFVNFIEAQTLNEVIETTSRYAEYKYGKVDTGATASAQQKLEAFMNSREATVDFERHGSGAAAKLIRQFVPFINASTQGVAQSIRAVVDPAERSRLAPRVAKVAFNYAITGALSALLMLKFNGGETDEEKERIAQAYIDEADDLKRQFILIPGLGLDGARDCWRLPVGQDMWGRMFYEFGRKGAEMYFTKADGYEDLVSNGFLADVLDVLVDASFGTFTEATTIFSPINEVLKNQNYYNEPIVSDKLQKQYYTNQYTDSTSDVYIVAARMANGILNMFGVDDRSDLRNVLSSPVALQYWTSQYTGLLGQIIPAMLSKDKFTGEVTPVKGLKKLVKNSFTLDLDTGSDIEAAVDELQQYTQEISAAADAQKDYIGLMDIRLTKDEMTEGVAQAKAWNATGGLFSELNKEKGALWSVYYDIMGDPNLSDAEKENRVEREVYAPIAELNKQALRELAPFEAKYRSSTWSEIKAAVSATDATMPNPARSQVAAANFNGGFADDWSNGAAYMTEFADVYDQSTGSTTMPYTAGLKSFDILGVNYEPSASDITAMEDEYYKYYSDAANKLVASKEWQNATLEEKQKKAKKVHSDAYAAAKKWYTDTYHIKTKK